MAGAGDGDVDSENSDIEGVALATEEAAATATEDAVEETVVTVGGAATVAAGEDLVVTALVGGFTKSVDASGVAGAATRVTDARGQSHGGSEESSGDETLEEHLECCFWWVVEMCGERVVCEELR